jgi:hypothetical protein
MVKTLNPVRNSLEGHPPSLDKPEFEDRSLGS